MDLRAWVTPSRGWTRRPRRTTPVPPGPVAVIDTEVLHAGHDRRTLACAYVYDGGELGRVVLGYSDDLPDLHPAGFAALEAYVSAHRPTLAAGLSPMGGARYALEPLSRWRHSVLYSVGYFRRGSIVGHNLPYDLGQLAEQWGPSTKWRGGWQLDFASLDNGQPSMLYPRLRLRRIGHGASMEWAPLRKSHRPAHHHGRHYGGHFVDTSQLRRALGGRRESLEKSCATWGIAGAKVACRWGVLDEALIEHLLADCALTSALYFALEAEVAAHAGIGLSAPRLFSTSTLADAYLEAMGLPAPPTTWENVDEAFGIGMAAHYGARAEAHVIGTPVPVIHADLSGAYALVAGLLGTWDVMRAARVAEVDATAEVREWASSPTLADELYHPSTWRRQGLTFVQVDASSGAQLVARTSAGGDEGLGVGPVVSEAPIWVHWCDYAVACLRGDAPPVLSAVRFEGRGIAESLRPVPLRGGATFDPGTENIFEAVTTERRAATATGDERTARFWKGFAVGLAWGVSARFDRRRVGGAPKGAASHKVTPVDLDVYVGRERTRWTTTEAEVPGRWTIPPVSAGVAAGARLLLGIVEAAVGAIGGLVAWMHTDAVMVVSTPDGGTVKVSDTRVMALSFDEVAAILGRFDSLGQGQPVWRVEHGMEAPTEALVTGPSSYSLWRSGAGGPVYVTGTGYGLEGRYIVPEGFAAEAWEAIRLRCEGEKVDALRRRFDWWEAPAAGRFALSTPTMTARFGSGRPFDFALAATGWLGGGGHVPVTAFTDDWQALAAATWTDHLGGAVIPVTTDRGYTEAEGTSVTSLGDIVLRSLGGRFERWATPEGEKVPRAHRGLLVPRPQVVTGRRLVGKSNLINVRDGGTDDEKLPRLVLGRTCAGCLALLVPPRRRWCEECEANGNAARDRRRVAEREVCALTDCPQPARPRSPYCCDLHYRRAWRSSKRKVQYR